MEPDSSFRQMSIYVTDDAGTEATIHCVISETFGVSWTLDIHVKAHTSDTCKELSVYVRTDILNAFLSAH